MNKLVSKNPVLRFKQQQIQKFQLGGYIPVKVGNAIFLYNPSNGTYKGSQFPGQNIRYEDIVNAYNNLYRSNNKSSSILNKGINWDWRLPDSGNNTVITNTSSQLENNLNPSLQKYISRRKLEILNSNIKQPYFLKAYAGRTKAIGGADKIIEWLKKLGVKADGIWGKNTEAAFVKKFGFNPNTDLTEVPMKEGELENMTPKTIEQPINYQNDFAQLKATYYPSVESPVMTYTHGYGAELARKARQFTFAKQGGLISKDPILRFKEGRKIEIFLNGGVKRFSVSHTDGSKKTMYFDTKEEAKAYQSKQKPGTTIWRDAKEEASGLVLKSNRTKEKATEWGRQQLEKNNNLSFKLAYQEGRKTGNKYFAWRGHVYKTDLENGKDNMTEMMLHYGNNLGYDKDPKLLTKSSRAARELYRKDVDAKQGNRRASYQGKTNKQVSAEADKKVTWNEEDFMDAISPATAIENGINGLFLGKDYKPTIAHSGLNPALGMANLVRGEWGKVGERALNAFSIFGGPAISKAVDWAGTKFAPEIVSVGNKSKYLSRTPRKSFIKKGNLKYINTIPELDETQKIVGMTLGGNPSMLVSSGKTLYDGTTLFGRRSIENAAKNGLLNNFSYNNGFNNVSRWANTAVRNNNTGTTYFFRNVDKYGNLILHPYDAAIENGMKVLPWVNTGIGPAINTTVNNLENYK